MSGPHEPVLLAETLAFLRNGAGLYLDATLGGGGHAEALLADDPGVRLLGCDRDPRALLLAGPRLERFGARVMLARASFHELPEVHRQSGGEPLTGALFDLGLSSLQIDDPGRGMSFMHEGPLDLRMDQTVGRGAAERLRSVGERELAQVLREHGDVRGAARLARAMVVAARAGRLSTTRDLVHVIEDAWGGRVGPSRLAPVFQSLRMWINEEAEELEAALAWLPRAVGPGGVVVTLAYHSGEDRRIKQALRGARGTHRRLPPAFGAGPLEGPWEEITRKVVTPSREETTRNPRSRSARLRAFRRRPA